MIKILPLFKSAFVNLLGYSVILVPLYALYYDNIMAMYYSYCAYSIMIIMALLYLIGSICCDRVIAMSIYFELKETSYWISYIPNVLMLAVATYSIYSNNNVLSLLIVTPMCINILSQQIIKHKAGLNNA